MRSNGRYYLYKIDGVPSISMRELEDNSEDLELAMSTEDIKEILSYLRDYYDYSDSEIEAVREIYESL